MRIQVAEVSDVITESGKNNKQYKSCVVSYYNNGKKYEKKLTQYSDAFKVLSAALPDQLFTVELKKNGQFTEWENVQPFEEDEAKVEAPKQTSTTKTVKPASGKSFQKSSNVPDPRETPEERKARQELIVRQSSLTNAIEFFKLRQAGTPANVNGGMFFVTEDAFFELAQKFRDWVYSAQEVTLTESDTVE